MKRHIFRTILKSATEVSRESLFNSYGKFGIKYTRSFQYQNCLPILVAGSTLIQNTIHEKVRNQEGKGYERGISGKHAFGIFWDHTFLNSDMLSDKIPRNSRCPHSIVRDAFELRGTRYFSNDFGSKDLHTSEGNTKLIAYEVLNPHQDPTEEYKPGSLWDPHILERGEGWDMNIDKDSETNLEIMPKIGFGSKGGYANRVALANAVHHRAPEILKVPALLSHLAVLRPESMVNNTEWCKTEWEHLALLCERHGRNPPQEGCDVFSCDMGSFHLRYERHQDFSTYTFTRSLPKSYMNPFEETATPISLVPDTWLNTFPGRVILALHCAVDSFPRTYSQLREVFSCGTFVGSDLVEGIATVFTDGKLHKDGFNRLIIYCGPTSAGSSARFSSTSIYGRGDMNDLEVDGSGMNPDQAGRITYRMLNVETYRILVLMGQPLAKAVLPRIERITHQVTDIMNSMNNPFLDHNQEGELLDRICKLTARSEGMSAMTIPRFSMAQAHHALVVERISSLSMTSIPGIQPYTTFVLRRINPALRHLEDASSRLSRQNAALHRSSSLLRTRVEVAVEGQNQQLMQNMAESQRHALHLQELAEGFSIGAITYYSAGLLGYMLKAIDKVVALPVPVEFLVGGSIPVLAIGMWFAIHKSKSAMVLMHGGESKKA